MDFRGFNYNSAEEIYDEYASMTKDTNIDVSFLNYDRLKTEGTFQWPVNEYRHSGTSRLFEDKKFYTPSQKAQFNLPSTIENTSVKPDENFPLILTTGRVRDQWHTMTKTGKVSRLKTHYPKPVLEINPIDAYLNKVTEGSIAEIKSKNGVVRLRTKVTDNVKKGVVFLPMHWGKVLQSNLNRANNLTNTHVDPVSKEPDFKYTAVSVSKYKKPKEKIIIAGAGAAAFRFLQNYRDNNEADEIHVFSKESNLFYNRVLLPEYITEELSWEQLLKINNAELKKLDIKIHPETIIDGIDKENKTVTDSNGETHSFDKLILATGSRPFIPKDVQIDLLGRFTMRNKIDADRFKTYLDNTGLPPEEQHVVILCQVILLLFMHLLIWEILLVQ